jgi:hypothetical protein
MRTPRLARQRVGDTAPSLPQPRVAYSVPIANMNIEAPHLAALVASVNRYPEIAEPIMRDATYAALLSLIPDLATYPSQQPTAYRRTGTLGRLWGATQPEYQPQGNGFQASIGNNTPYGPFVQGGPDDDRPQTQVMADKGWANVAEVVAAHQDAFDAYLEAALNKILLQVGT